MRSLIVLGLLAFVIYRCVNRYLRFRTNIKRAKATGIHYIPVPLYFLERWWLIFHRLFLPLLERLPEKYTQWVDFVLPEFTYDYRHDIFKRIGHDTFMTVSPDSFCLYTAEPAVISQITTRRNDFPKPTHIYRSIDIYGKNVVSTESAAWRQHRKATSPPFTEKNNHLVWNESIRQAQAMLKAWVGPDGEGNKTVDRMMDDTMRLSLYVITCAGFGRKLEWPAEGAATTKDNSGYVDPSKIENEDVDIDPGHTMSYTYAVHCLLDNILFQFLLPRWVLSRAPIARLKKANESYIEWGNYMREAVHKKKEDMESAKDNKEQMDILAQLVKSQLVQKDGKGVTPLTEEEVLGNMFVLILAGHETAANSIHFSCLFLALHGDSQKRLQRDLEQSLQGRPPSEWEYDRDLPALFGGMPGAILAEELRLVPPVVGIPKSTKNVGEQKLTVEGKECIVPGDSYICLATAAAHRNPKYWPSSTPTLPGGRPSHPRANLDNDLEEFRPERWLVTDGKIEEKEGIPLEQTAGDDLGVNESSDTSDRLFKPTKGAYLPFSDGYRACLGRRFAQVEVLAVLAVLFQNYSVELAVDKYATDEEIEKMNENERVEIWRKAAEDARNLMLTGLGVIITLQMRAGKLSPVPTLPLLNLADPFFKGTVPFRFVPKGKERFPPNADEIWKRNNPDKVSSKGNPRWSCWRRGDGEQVVNDGHIKL